MQTLTGKTMFDTSKLTPDQLCDRVTRLDELYLKADGLQREYHRYQGTDEQIKESMRNKYQRAWNAYYRYRDFGD